MISSYLRDTVHHWWNQERNSEQKLEAESPHRNRRSTPGPRLVLLHSLSEQVHPPRASRAHDGLGHPMLINHQQIPSRNSHRTIWWRQFFHGVSTPRCVKLTTKDSQPHVDFWNRLGQLLKSILNSCVIFLLCIRLSFANIRKYLPSTGQEPRYLVLS